MAPKKSAVVAKKKKQLSFQETAEGEASKAVETTRHVAVAAKADKKKPAAAPAKKAPVASKKKSGIVEAKKAVAAEADAVAASKRKRVVIDVPEEEDDADSLVDDSDASADDEEDNLSDIADGASSSSDSDNEADLDNPFVRARREGTKLSYPALRLRFLPAEFQEPQLFKFLGQFGANVLNCFCVRSRRTHQSKGIAYVQFDNESVLPIVLEECHGMSLGGRAVQARKVILHRAMPSKEKVSRRRQLAYAYKTKGAPLKHHNVANKSPVALLIKAARTERNNNDHLKKLGIDYATDMFTSQIARIPADLIVKKKSMVAALGGVTAAPAAAAAKKKAASPKKAAAPSPKKKAAAPTPKKATPKKAATPKKK